VLGGAALVVGVAAAIAAVFAAHASALGAVERARFDPAVAPLAGVSPAALPFAVFGAWVAVSEYATGTIRATLAAVPRRTPVLWAKLAVVAAVAATTGLVATSAAQLLAHTLLAGHGVPTSLGTALRSVPVATAHLTAAAVLGVTVGFLLRNTLAAVCATFGALLVAPILLDLLPAGLTHRLGEWLPTRAGEALWAGHGGHAVLHGAVVLGLWVSLGVLGARVRLLGTDA